jgi:hypothetical protein
MQEGFWAATTEVIALDRRLTGVGRKRSSLEGSPALSRARRRPAVVLGVFFLSLYLLTMGGHLDSPDEELMFQVTRSLAERGSMDIGTAASPEQLAQTGVDGRQYTHYGPVTSLLSVPFYDLGRAAAALMPPRYTDVVERFAVGLRDPLISAAACVVFYAIAVDFGFGTAVAILLTLAFGVATFVWPLVRYSWSEPVTGFWLLLSVYAAMRALRTAPLKWSAISSIALGLAIGSKITTAVAAPALLLFLVAGGPGSLRRRLERALPFGLMLLLPAIGIAILNVVRFGSPLVTGYYMEGYLWHPIGLAGLLVSPSKSLFLYAPVALLGLLGFTRLATRFPWQSAVFFWLVAAHVLVYGLLVVWWHGDAAWGPRYLMPVVPFVVLPAGALLAWTSGVARQLAWDAFRVLVGLGLVVNLGGVLVDQRVSFADLLQDADYNLVRMEDQRWDPSLSPVLIHWGEFTNRVGIFVHWWSQPVSLVSGTYAKEPVDPIDADEAARSDLFPRWTSGSAAFAVKSHDQPVQLTLEYADNRPGALGPAVVQIYVDGARLSQTDARHSVSSTPLPDERPRYLVNARLDDAVRGKDTALVEIRSQTWQPARDTPPNADIRDLGIQIWNVRFESNGHDLSLSEAPFSPMPVTDARPWSYEVETWFYTAPHLADVWLWYLYLSGLPVWLMLLGLAPVAGLAWSGMHLRRYLT